MTGIVWDEFAIVDDNKFDRLICERIIRRIDGKTPITEFQTGKEILNYLLSENFGSKNLLIFLDLNMPEMNGYEFLQEFMNDPRSHALKAQIKVVIITSSTRREDKDQTAKYDLVVGFLQKPIMVEHVESVMSLSN